MMERMVFAKLRTQLWSIVAGPAVLEVGVGTGNNMRHYRHDIAVTAIDLSDRMLDLARRRAEREQVDVRLLEMDAQDLQFPEQTFDCAVSTCVFCSVPDPMRGLMEVRRVLKPGGRFILAEHVRAPSLLGTFFDLLNPIVLHFSGANINRRTVENVVNAGFEIEHVQSRFLGIVKLIVARNPRSGAVPLDN
jgi:ubiquinone/menaquinone biosynthesis C-methylase UbiE